jgi:hypothetical protein
MEYKEKSDPSEQRPEETRAEKGAVLVQGFQLQR